MKKNKLVTKFSVHDNATYFEKLFLLFLLCRVAGTLIGLSYLILLYGLYVPDWFFEISSLDMESAVSGYELSTQTVRIFLKCSKILLFSGSICWWLLNAILFLHQTSVKFCHSTCLMLSFLEI